MDIRYVQPDAAAGPGYNSRGQQHAEYQQPSHFFFLECVTLAYRDDNQNQRGNANNNDKYVSVTEISRRDILLYRARLGCHPSGIFIAQLADRLIHLGIVRTGGLQGFLALFCG